MKVAKLFSITLIALMGLSFTLSNREESNKGLKNGDKMPLAEQEMASVDGNSYSLNKLMDKKGLIVVFSCNTCPFVVGGETFGGWEQQYNDLYTFAKEKGVGFVLINSNAAKRENDDSMEAMKKRSAEKGYQMQYLVDEQSALANAFGARTTPHVYFFNEKSELIYQGAIDNTVDAKRKSDETYLKDAINNHASEQKIRTESTPPRGCSIKRVAI